MERVSGSSGKSVSKPPENTSEPSGSCHGRSVTPGKIPGIPSHSDDGNPVKAEEPTQKPLTSRKTSWVETQGKSRLAASVKRSQQTSQAREELKEPLFSVDVIDWEGSFNKQLEQLASNIQTALRKNDTEAQRKKEKERKRKAKESRRAAKNNASPLMTLDSSSHKKAAKDQKQKQKQAGSVNYGFFHSHHPDRDHKMTHSHLLAHLKIVEKIEDILLEILKAPASQSNSHAIRAEAFEETLMEIEELVDEWRELPPGDTTVYPREGLKDLIDQFRSESGYAIERPLENKSKDQLEDEAKQIDFFLSQCRQLFPIDESGSLNRADDTDTPATSYFREVSEKIKDMLRYQTD
ncbi:hypothetical protein [Endozoicomonas euniceicola]|uniref:Uncharacterized protein n=1 Tax=Endozoicomonas euniceicola TaxID=1234143 RepID=A0ABY6GNJ8_9GAMM|nr:hypothetical protein [Endozoicomonas euniceicola]UYM14305.1 hypothetical protein NX720_15515 [Endozoicomonas euniceicola]